MIKTIMPILYTMMPSFEEDGHINNRRQGTPFSGGMSDRKSSEQQRKMTKAGKSAKKSSRKKRGY